VQLTLYVDGYFVSQWDASCMIALDEKQLPYTAARALLRDGGGVPAALAARTGIATVPTLQHGELFITESQAIIEYLEDVFPQPPVLPRNAVARAQARQIMSFVRTSLWSLREEREMWTCFYPQELPLPPLSPAASADVRALYAVVEHVDLSEWTIAHVDLALSLVRLARTGHELPPKAQRLLDASLVRPSVRAYLEHPRPPNPPPHKLRAG
jgi:glutathione S-transferase